jgi:hypothetical protein
MANLEFQMYHGLYLLLTSNPITVLINYALVIGLLSGILSILPFGLIRVPITFMGTIALIAWFYCSYALKISTFNLLYAEKAYWIIKFLGDFVIGILFGI